MRNIESRVMITIDEQMHTTYARVRAKSQGEHKLNWYELINFDTVSIAVID